VVQRAGASEASGFQFLGIPPKGELMPGRFAYSPDYIMFPISRDPPEGGTDGYLGVWVVAVFSFQFLGIPPKGELLWPQ